MNPSHYPSLELCKKLTEIGFNRSELRYSKKGIGVITFGQQPEIYDKDWDIVGIGHIWDGTDYYCPSVMEMLDVMPNWIIVNYKDGDIGNYKLEIGRQGTSESIGAYYVHYVEGNGAYSFMLGTLPNALAEMCLWLVENKYLTFNNEKS